MFDIEFCCPPCIVAGLQPLGSFDEDESCSYLWRLALDTLRSSSGRLALSTWRNYIACVREAVDFTARYGVVCFPVVNEQTSRGCMLFFQHLRAQGRTWNYMRVRRSAFKKFHAAIGVQDPWALYPALSSLTEGLQKQVTLPPVQKVGLTIQMVKAVLQFADSAILEASKRGNWQRADVLLREAVAMLLGFFAMRRSDELFVNKTHTHGLLQKHIVLVPDSHVSLFVQAQKTDCTRQGHHITLAWASGSGVLIGSWVVRLLARLKRCGCFGPALPLFLPTKGHQGYRIVRPGSAVSKPDFRRLLQQVFAVFRRHPSLLALFNWHSCRRGGATHAYWTGTALDLLAPHGGWNSMEGLQVYISASFIQRLSVTQRM